MTNFAPCYERRERVAAQRRTVLRLTVDGVAARDRYRCQHRQAFEYITRDWPAEEQLEFAHLLVKYADADGCRRCGRADDYRRKAAAVSFTRMST